MTEHIVQTGATRTASPEQVYTPYLGTAAATRPSPTARRVCVGGKINYVRSSRVGD